MTSISTFAGFIVFALLLTGVPVGAGEAARHLAEEDEPAARAVDSRETLPGWTPIVR